MNRCSSLIFIFIFTANAFAIALMGIWYINDQDYFTDNFCINKEKVEMQCNGRCHLQKQIHGQTQDGDKQEISVKVLEFEFLLTEKIVLHPVNSQRLIKNNYKTHIILYGPPFLSREHLPPIV